MMLLGLVTQWLEEGYEIRWLVGWIYGISTFVGYLTPIPFLYK